MVVVVTDCYFRIGTPIYTYIFTRYIYLSYIYMSQEQFSIVLPRAYLYLSTFTYIFLICMYIVIYVYWHTCHISLSHVTGAVQHCSSKSLPWFCLLPSLPLFKVKVDHHHHENIGDANFDGFDSGNDDHNGHMVRWHNATKLTSGVIPEKSQRNVAQLCFISCLYIAPL